MQYRFMIDITVSNKFEDIYVCFKIDTRISYNLMKTVILKFYSFSTKLNDITYGDL